MIDWEQENRPLPKRQRSKAEIVASNSSDTKQDENVIVEKGTCIEQSQQQSLQTFIHHTTASQKCDNRPEGLTKEVLNVAVASEYELSLEPVIKEHSDHHGIETKFMHTTLQKQQIEQALGPGIPDEVLSSCFHISLKRCDFWLLRNTEWLNDKVNNK